MGLFSIIGKVAGAIIGGNSAKSSQKALAAAQQAQADAANRAIALDERRYGEATTNLTPSITTGNDALGGIRDLTGLNGTDHQASSIDALKSSPLYQSLFGNGRDSILAASSATGGLRGGNIQDALFRNGRDTLAQVIQQQLANLGGIQQSGQQAGLGLAGIGANEASAVGQQQTNIGNSQAGAILGRQAVANANASNNGSVLGSIFSSFDTSGGLSGINAAIANLLGRNNISDSAQNGGIGGTLNLSSGPLQIPYSDPSSLTQRLPF